MTKCTAVVFGIFIILASPGFADAHHNDGLEGFLIGGIGGAVIGHAVSPGPEGVIVGSILGSTLGMLIDAETNWNHVVVVKGPHRHHRHGSYYKGPRPYRGDRYYYGRHDRRHRWDRHRGRYYR